MFLGLSIAFLAMVADQLSKYYMQHEVLAGQQVIFAAPGFNLVRAWNTGVSFSMFNNYGNLGAWLLSGAALVIVGFLLWWLKNETSRLSQVALGLIIGGALGNVIDRVRLGAVFDFLDFYIGESHWPAFNLADSFICIGAAILIWQSAAGYLYKEKGEK